MKRFICIFSVISLLVITDVIAQTKDLRQTYLWDVTLSMKGYNGSPDIYDKVVDVMIKDIDNIDNERTEIVVIPFQDKVCEVWRADATASGKAKLKAKIKAYHNKTVTHTNISGPLEFVIKTVISGDKIDILKLMTDGKDNVDSNKYNQILENWCTIAKEKDVYGYYILLTNAAKSDVSLRLKDICNFEVVDVTDGNIVDIVDITQLQPKFADAMSINVRDEYNKSKRLEFTLYMSDKVPEGYEIHFKTKENDYIKIDEVVKLNTDLSVSITPEFLQKKSVLTKNLPTEYNLSEIILEYKPTSNMSEGKYRNVRLVDKECKILLVNKPEKTVRIYVKE